MCLPKEHVFEYLVSSWWSCCGMLWNPEEAELSWKALIMKGGYFLSLSLLPAWWHLVVATYFPCYRVHQLPHLLTLPQITLPTGRFHHMGLVTVTSGIGWSGHSKQGHLSPSTPNTQGRTLSYLYGSTWIYTPLKFLFENYKLKPHLTVMTVSGFPTHSKNGKFISWSQNQ